MVFCGLISLTDTVIGSIQVDNNALVINDLVLSHEYLICVSYPCPTGQNSPPTQSPNSPPSSSNSPPPPNLSAVASLRYLHIIEDVVMMLNAPPIYIDTPIAPTLSDSILLYYFPSAIGSKAYVQILSEDGISSIHFLLDRASYNTVSLRFEELPGPVINASFSGRKVVLQRGGLEVIVTIRRNGFHISGNDKKRVRVYQAL
jgi:hypothetical protein